MHSHEHLATHQLLCHCAATICLNVIFACLIHSIGFGHLQIKQNSVWANTLCKYFFVIAFVIIMPIKYSKLYLVDKT